jgi:hypothetical protein
MDERKDGDEPSMGYLYWPYRDKFASAHCDGTTYVIIVESGLFPHWRLMVIGPSTIPTDMLA